LAGTAPEKANLEYQGAYKQLQFEDFMAKPMPAMWSILYYVRNDPSRLKWSQRRRGLDESIVDRAVELDRMWRRLKREIDELRHDLNVIASSIPKLEGREREEAVKRAKRLRDILREKETRLKAVEEERERVLLSIPNVVHDTVPYGRGEEDNVPVRYWGKPKVWKGYLDRFLKEVEGLNVDYEVIDYKPVGHADAVVALGYADVEKASKVAGARFYYLFDDLVWLDFALMLYALDYLSRKGFKVVEPPFMLRRMALEGVISFEDFRDMIYKVEDEDLYLIGTAEHPIAALHIGDVIAEKDLPLLYAGVSPCFRKEAGAHGKDTKGIFRVHQFNKVEQFVFSHPDESWKWHEQLIKNAEELWQGLGIPYRVVNICTGDLGVVAAKKYDLEAWMPAQGRYREMVSCSNCTDWQSYRLRIRYAESPGAPAKGYVHTLNSTAIATQRAITAIIENFQDTEGRVEIPKVLRKYLEPFEAAPKDYIEPRKPVK